MPETMARMGALNLLQNCAGMAEGQSLLILTEEAQGGYYDAGLADLLLRTAQEIGLRAKCRTVMFDATAARPDRAMRRAMASADRTLFLARIGDQLRFSRHLEKLRPVVSYALDKDMLASGFGRAHHSAFCELKDCLNAALAAAQNIRVTCPLGTDFSGPGAAFPQAGGETSIARFPLSVFSPVPAARYAGTIAQAGFLTGTGVHYYEPYTLRLEDVLLIRFEGNRITGFDGAPIDAARAEAHYNLVGGLLGLRPDSIHSWHAGIHPGCSYTKPAAANPARWGGAAFGNPRVLHFHSCGEVPPGEISINVIDPTIRLDGVAVWQDGRLYPERVPGGAEILARYPCAAALFDAPAQDIGLNAAGRLSA